MRTFIDISSQFRFKYTTKHGKENQEALDIILLLLYDASSIAEYVWVIIDGVWIGNRIYWTIRERN
jgi:hypothetical protein